MNRISLSLILALGLASSSARALAPGAKAPHFSLPDLNGKTWTPESVSKGKLVLVDFWASWCVPCLKEIPALKKLQVLHGADGRFSVLGIAMENGGREAVLAAVKKYGVDYQVLVGSPDAAKAFGVQGFPTAVLVKNGKVLKVLVGERKLSDFEDELKPFLALDKATGPLHQ